MNLSKVLKQKRDAEDRLRQSSPQVTYLEDNNGGQYINLASLATKAELTSGLASKADNTITGTIAPTTSIVGTLGQFYLDTITSKTYQCTAINGSVYTWTEIGGGGGSKYELPQATETVLGGIKAKAKTTETVEVSIDSATGKAYVPPAGEAANGLPPGGTVGQILSKIDGIDYNTQWVTPSSGGSSVFNPDTPPSSPSVWDDEFSDGIIATAWEDYNLANGTKAEASDVQVLKIGAVGSGLSHQGLIKTCPTANFTITIKQVSNATLSASWRYGIIVAESKTGNAYVLTSLAQNSSSFRTLWESMSSPTARTGYAIGEAMEFPYVYLRMQVYNDAGIWKVNSSWSKNGYKYNLFNTARALGFTPAYIGLVVNSEGIGGINEGWFDWFRVTED